MGIFTFNHQDCLVKIFTEGRKLDYIQQKIVDEKNFYEHEMLIDIQGYLTTPGIVIDVGANIGNHTIFFSKVCERKVIAIEPHNLNIQRLRKNIEINGLDNRVQIIEAAAGDKIGKVSLEIPDDTNMGSVRVKREGGGNCELLTLDSLQLTDAVALIKIDVEGFERQVLSGARKLIGEHQPLICVESQTKEQFDAVCSILLPEGYAVLNAYNATPTFLFFKQLQTGSGAGSEIVRRATRRLASFYIDKQDEYIKRRNLARDYQAISRNLLETNNKYRELSLRYKNLGENNKELGEKNKELNEIVRKNELIVNQLRNEEILRKSKIKRLQNKVVSLKESEAWKVGYVTVKAFRNPGKNTFLWIPRLIKIFLHYILRPRKTREKAHKKSEKKSVTNSSPARPLQQSVFTIKNVAPIKLKKNESFNLRERITADNLSELRVACVMDEFTYNAYAPECKLLQLTPEEWENEIKEFKPDVLFIESAWSGKDGLWQRKVNFPGGELSDIIAWCNREKVPTAFWNKEDPVHFQTFIERAKLFDFVFTTDIDCICSYKKALQSDHVYLLPFAAQPALHNPIEKFTRKKSFCFAGAYYPRYPKRIKDFNTFFDTLSEEPGFDIFDRNYNIPDSEFAFPEQFRSHILGYLPHDQIDIAYKGYCFGINMNSIKQSPSMFARRVFELIASNTITVSNYSRGVRDFFGDLVVSTDDKQNLQKQLAPFFSDEIYYKKIRLKALRKVLSQHTYRERLAYLAEKIWDLPRKDVLPTVTVIGLASDDKQLDSVVNSFNRQYYANKKLIIVTAEKFNPSNLSDSVAIITWKQANEMKCSDLVPDGYWSFFHHSDYYGEHYIFDIMLATKYCKADIIGKEAITVNTGKILRHYSEGSEYKYVTKLPYRSSIVSAAFVSQMALSDYLENLDSGVFGEGECFSVDEFNYCRDYSGDSCFQVDDLQNINIGLSLGDIEQTAENLYPVYEEYRLTQLDGQTLMELVEHDTSREVRFRKENRYLNVFSELDGEKRVIFKGKKFIRFDHSGEKKEFKVFFETSPGLSIKLIIYFYDENLKKITHRIIDANRNYQFPTLKFDLIQIGLQITGKGNGVIHRVVFDNVPHHDPLLSHAETLLITPHYPSYDNLYRFGFVHSRIVLYQQCGMAVDVLRFNDMCPKEYFEFNNIDIVSGATDILKQAFNGNRYSSVLVHFLTPDMWEVLREFVGQVPIIIWLHGAEVQPWYRRKFNYNTIEEEQEAKELSDIRMALWRDVFSFIGPSLHFVFVSEYFANEVMEDVGIRIPRENYSIIHNIINTELFSYIPKTAEHRKKILTIRPFASAKYANDLTVKAILLLSKESFFTDLEFRIIGDGVLFDELLEPLRGFANVIIEKRFLKQEEIADLHHDYGVFLTPTRMDAQGVSRDEAMSCGLVPITNNITAIPEFVDDNCGMLVDGEDYKGMAEAIKRLYHNPDLFLHLSENAARRVREQSSRKQTVEKEISLIRSMVQ